LIRHASLILCALLLWSSGARADEKRKIAVLEYRSGSRGAPDVAMRLATALAKSTSYRVIDPVEGRRRLGAGLDAEVAHCAGEAHCTAALAERLSADEALLVGVSQLGDIVLALQRIDVHKGIAASRLAESLPADKQPDDSALADWLHQLFPAEAFLRYGDLRIVSDVDGALVSINATRRGSTPIDPLRLPAPGNYRVRVEKTGFMPFQARIELPPDTSVEVRAALSRETKQTAWYRRWYVWAAIGGVAVAATGVGLAAYYGTRVDQTPHGYLVFP
jgi:hypothetical protein